jgi:hypothetical protein
MERPIPEADCEKIYNILLEAGATEYWRQDFVMHMSGTTREYRFGGMLGFGGKFYNCADRWYISCYPEDRTEARGQMIENINAKLRALQES